MSHGGRIKAEMLRSDITGTDKSPNLVILVIWEIEPERLLESGLLGTGFKHVLAHVESDRGETGIGSRGDAVMTVISSGEFPPMKRR